MKIYEAWEELKSELVKFTDGDDCHLKPIPLDINGADLMLAEQVLMLIEKLEYKYE